VTTGPGGVRFPVRPGLTGREYLEIVHGALPKALDAVRPDLVIYNAGSDPFEGDSLAGFRLTEGDLAERDLLVVSMA
jgi:acetoin utilization deacetylase AcuC-like enzyme